MEEWSAQEALERKEFQKGSRIMGIFELADLFGITTEALRKYEAKGIIQPYRDENGYRKYSSWDLIKIVQVRQLRQEGISLGNIAEGIAQETPQRQLQDMELTQRQLAEEIACREKLIRWIGAQREEIRRLEELGENCVIEEQSRRYCCVCMVGDTLVSKKGRELACLKEWIQALPFARVCYVGSSPANENMYSCLFLREEELEAYDLRHLTADFVLPAGAYAVCGATAEHTQERDTSEACIAAAREKAKELGMRLTDRNMLEMVWYTQRDGLFRSHNKATFLIEK